MEGLDDWIDVEVGWMMSKGDIGGIMEGFGSRVGWNWNDVGWNMGWIDLVGHVDSLVVGKECSRIFQHCCWR